MVTNWLDRPLFEPALLRAATRRASTFSDAARERMAPWALGARARYLVALELRDPASRGVAFALLRDAAFFALCALRVGEGEASAPAANSRAAWQRFSAQMPDAVGAPSDWERVRDAFSTDEPLSLEALAASDDGELRLAAEATVAWLLGLAEVRSPKALKRARIVRGGLTAVVTIALVWALLAYYWTLTALELPAH